MCLCACVCVWGGGGGLDPASTLFSQNISGIRETRASSASGHVRHVAIFSM